MPSSWAYGHTFESLSNQNYLLLSIISILQTISIVTNRKITHVEVDTHTEKYADNRRAASSVVIEACYVQ